MTDYRASGPHEPHPTPAAWLMVWMEAATRQHRRVRDTQELMEFQSDLMLLAVAIGAVVLNCEGILGKGHHELQRFRAACPEAEHVRDIASHLDEYAKGTGRLQLAGSPDGGTFLSRRRHLGTIELHLFGHRLEVETTMTALQVLADAAMDRAS